MPESLVQGLGKTIIISNRSQQTSSVKGLRGRGASRAYALTLWHLPGTRGKWDVHLPVIRTPPFQSLIIFKCHKTLFFSRFLHCSLWEPCFPRPVSHGVWIKFLLLCRGLVFFSYLPRGSLSKFPCPLRKSLGSRIGRQKVGSNLGWQVVQNGLWGWYS